MEYKMISLDSKSELQAKFSKLPEPKVLIDCSNSSPNQYKLINIDTLVVGIIDHTFGVPIQIEAIDDNSALLIGHESQIDFVSIQTARILWTVKVDSVFFQFKRLQKINSIIVIEETGMFALDQAGNRIWSLSTDIITDSEIEDSYVKIKTIEEDELKVSSRTGERLR